MVIKKVYDFNKKHKFGWKQGNHVLHAFRADTPNKILPIYQQHKMYLYGVNKVTLQYAKKSMGNTGARYFKYEVIPPLAFWNQDVIFEEVKQSIGTPSVTIEYTNGKTDSFEATNLKSDQIFAKLMEKTKLMRPTEVEDATLKWAEWKYYVEQTKPEKPEGFDTATTPKEETTTTSESKEVEQVITSSGEKFSTDSW